jgi:hypothetical protein
MSLETIDRQTGAALWRPISAQVHFSDVFSETAPTEQDWWRYSDFDASLTVRAESGALEGLTEVPIGERPWLTQYGLV